MVWGKSRTVSTRKVKAITEELGGHSFSASSISAMNQRLDANLAQFAGRPLAEAFPYLILDARYERVREAGVIVSQAVLIAISIAQKGDHRHLPRSFAGYARPGTSAIRGVISCRPVEPVSTAASGLDSLPAQYLETI